MTTLLLIRHGEVPGISPPRFRGRQELELTERGRAQAQRTAERVHADWPQIAAIYCSPRHRTVATAQAIGRPNGLEPKAMPELDDFDYGTWQGLSHEEARERWPDQWSLWTTAPESVVFPQGETLADVAARVGRGLHNILAATRERSGAVVIVAHDSVNRVLLMQLLGMPLRFYRAIAQDPCCINVIDDPGPAAHVRLVNSTEHLDDL
jgi:broad specificity phosphatase PhoE